MGARQEEMAGELAGAEEALMLEVSPHPCDTDVYEPE